MFSVHENDTHDEHEVEGGDWRPELLLAVVCLAAAIGAAIAVRQGASHWWWLPSYLAGSWSAAGDMIGSLRRRRVDVHLLMLVVAWGAWGLEAYSEGATLLFLFSFSGALESYAQDRTERAIGALLKHAPEEATEVLADGSERVVRTDAIVAGMRLRLRPGDRVPADVEVTEGRTATDESMLTGESLPVSRMPGDSIPAGVVNLDGSVIVKVLRPPSQSTLQRLVSLVLDARKRRAPSQKLTDRFEGWYPIAILGGAAVYALILRGFGVPWHETLYRAMTLLVVASPCALVLSIPSAILAAIAAAARRGVLFRNGGAVETLATVNVMAFDKTGTLTTGQFSVKSIETTRRWSEAEVLPLLAAAESGSEHPIARAIMRDARERGIEPAPVDSFRAFPGEGISATIGGTVLHVGTLEFIAHHAGEEAAAPWLEREPSIREVHIYAARGEDSALILLEDELRPDAASAVRAVADSGCRALLLSGDHEAPVAAVAERAGMAEWRARQRPEDKLRFFEEARAAGARTAMVGDGVNDAAAIAAADAGIVLGGIGSDAAIEQASIVLASGRLSGIATAWRISLRARTIIRQNLAISIGTMVVLAIFAIVGLVPLPLAVIGHEGSTAIVVLNSLRLLRIR